MYKCFFTTLITLLLQLKFKQSIFIQFYWYPYAMIIHRIFTFM